MPKFSVKSLLFATTLIALGIGTECILFRTIGQFGDEAEGLLWFGGGALIGAGLFVPFQRPVFGAVFGVAIQGILIYLQLIGVLQLG